MADNTTVKDSAGATVTAATADIGGGVQAPKVVLVSAAGVATQGTPADAAWASGSGTEISLLKTIATAALDTSDTPISAASLPLPTGAATEATLSAQSAKLPASLGAKTGAASLSVVPASDGFAITATGNVASAATDSGNPIKIGGKYNATLPTYVDGQRGDVGISSRSVLLSAPVSSAAGADALTNSNIGTCYAGNATTALMQIAPTAFNGTSWDRQRGDVAGLVVQPYAMAGSRLQYAAASGGISNTTTAVTIFAAAGASTRNYLTALQITAEALGTATELAIRDGAAGTVIWRTKIGTGGLTTGQSIRFEPPLRGTANTLMEIVTLTASGTGAVYVNAQGYTSTV